MPSVMHKEMGASLIDYKHLTLNKSPPRYVLIFFLSIQSQGLKFTGNNPVVIRMMMSKFERRSLLNA